MTMTFVLLAAILIPGAEPSTSRAETNVSLGISSCTASACHGGPAGVKGKEWNSSYTVWATKDPHADAFATLSNERSKNIVARLCQSAKEDPRALVERRCLVCHATVGGIRHSVDGFSEDGVSCASCHGPAGEWLGNSHAGRLITGIEGMTNTKGLATRAKECVGCHVGSPGNNGQPDRDVNHDLIAAGHPRLNFEFAAYLASLPAHWDEDKDRNRVRQPNGAKHPRGNFAAEAWATGQLVAANAALELLESRAAAAGRLDTNPSDPRSRRERATLEHAWPEFSEISCYACHHDLRSPSFRQQRQLLILETPANRRSPGSLVWGTWYFPMPRLLLAHQAGAANDEKSWSDLEQAMSTIRPDPHEVVRLSSQLRQHLTPLIAAPVNPQQTVERLKKSVEGQPAPGGDWDKVVQWYLAAVARHQALQEHHAGNRQREREKDLRESQDTLEKLRDQLESPHAFDPTDMEFRRLVEQLLQQLARLDG